MKIRNLSLLVFLPMFCMAQFKPPDQDKPPDKLRKNISHIIASGLNYYCFIPLRESSPEFMVDNLSPNENHILFIGETREGVRVRELLKIRENENIYLPADLDLDYERIYLISMQPFHVQTEEPIDLLGHKTRHFTTVRPIRNLGFVKIENALGNTFMAGITPDGTTYYPVFGQKLGSYDPQTQTVVKADGTVYDVIE